MTIEKGPSIFPDDYGPTTSAEPHRTIATALPNTLRAIVKGDNAAYAVCEVDVYTPSDAGRTSADNLYGIFNPRLRDTVFRADARSDSYGVVPYCTL